MNNDGKFHANPFKALLHPVGMFNTVPEMDLGRFSQLYLDDGVWTYDGRPKRILPEGWASYVAAPAPA